MFSNRFQSDLFDETHFGPKRSILNWSGPLKMQLTGIYGPELDLSEKCGTKLQEPIGPLTFGPKYWTTDVTITDFCSGSFDYVAPITGHFTITYGP